MGMAMGDYMPPQFARNGRGWPSQCIGGFNFVQLSMAVKRLVAYFFPVVIERSLRFGFSARFLRGLLLLNAIHELHHRPHSPYGGAQRWLPSALTTKTSTGPPTSQNGSVRQ
jgi:hypothetical protein